MSDPLRAALLQAHEELRSSLAALAPQVNAGGAHAVTYLALEDALDWRGEELRDAYLRLLPARAISRCPFTDDLVVIRIDTTELDGLWWSRAHPLRRTIAAPETFAGLTGAVSLQAPLPDAPFAVEPGPGAPFVLPDVLTLDDVCAVVSTVPIGAHTGYAIAYFSRQPAHPALLAGREWGMSDDLETDLDFDLAPWIDRGKLRWIEPGDDTLQLRSELQSCPFIGSGGTRTPQRIERGALR